MASGPPKAIAIDHDDYHAKYVGRTADNRQFFLTTPFVPAIGHGIGGEFIALYVFDQAGKLVSHVIENFGPRATLDDEARLSRRDALLASLGNVEFQRIKVAPFRLEMYGVEFGLISQPPEEPDEDWCVTVEPGNYMCFYPPWTSGDYDT